MQRWLRSAIWLVLVLILVVGGALLTPLTAASAHTAAQRIYAQQLVDRTVNHHPELLDMILHVTPPNSTQNMAIAAYTEKERGQRSGDDDIAVMVSGKPLVEVQKDGVRIGILLPLDDRSGIRVGALGLMYKYAGDSQAGYLARAERVRTETQRAIASRKQLFEFK